MLLRDYMKWEIDLQSSLENTMCNKSIMILSSEFECDGVQKVIYERKLGLEKVPDKMS